MTMPISGNVDQVAGSRPSRTFNVGDAMILVAGTAFLLAFGRWQHLAYLLGQIGGLCRTIAAYNSSFTSAQRAIWQEQLASYWSTVCWYGLQLSEGLLLALVPTFLLVRFRRPRPPIRALLRQPGTVASLAFVFGVVWVTGWLHRLFLGKFNYWTANSVAAGCAVAVAWALLALSRKWEAEPSWVDRLGRVLGAVAIANGLLVVAWFGI
ncbi:MAG: hypothetical protein U0790_05580 [Isosphaeraceae bacterium]